MLDLFASQTKFSSKIDFLRNSQCKQAFSEQKYKIDIKPRKIIYLKFQGFLI